MNFFVSFLLFFIFLFSQVFGQCSVTETNALMDFYTATNGLAWTKNYNWGTSYPCNTWEGVLYTPGIGVTSLFLESHNLVGILPESIGYLTNLTDLVLGYNFLHGFIPATIGNLVRLKKLDFYANRLIGSLPSSIGNLVSLNSFNVGYNFLNGTIPSEIGNLFNLQVIYMINNQFSGSLPSSIGNLSKLLTLGLNDNRLSGTIPSTLENILTLQILGLKNNFLTSISILNPKWTLNLCGLTGNPFFCPIPQWATNCGTGCAETSTVLATSTIALTSTLNVITTNIVSPIVASTSSNFYATTISPASNFPSSSLVTTTVFPTPSTGKCNKGSYFNSDRCEFCRPGIFYFFIRS